MNFNERVITWVNTSTACPTQYEGMVIDGDHFYFRYRFGHLQIGFGPDIDSAVLATINGPCYNQVIDPDGWAGFMTDEEARKHMLNALDWKHSHFTHLS